jgi:Ni/Co efflux regulator RcnB
MLGERRTVMKRTLIYTAVIAALLPVVVAVGNAADQTRDQDRLQTPDQDQTRDRDRLQTPDHDQTRDQDRLQTKDKDGSPARGMGGGISPGGGMGPGGGGVRTGPH